MILFDSLIYICLLFVGTSHNLLPLFGISCVCALCRRVRGYWNSNYT